MENEDISIVDLVLQHDKSITALTESINQMMQSNNRALDHMTSILDIVTSKPELSKQIESLEKKLSEYAKKYDDKIDKLHEMMTVIEKDLPISVEKRFSESETKGMSRLKLGISTAAAISVFLFTYNHTYIREMGVTLDKDAADINEITERLIECRTQSKIRLDAIDALHKKKGLL